MKRLPKFDVFFNAYSGGRRRISTRGPHLLSWLFEFCKTTALLFLFVTNTDIISTGSGMGVHAAGCLPVAWLFTTKQIFSLLILKPFARDWHVLLYG